MDRTKSTCHAPAIAIATGQQ